MKKSLKESFLKFLSLLLAAAMLNFIQACGIYKVVHKTEISEETLNNYALQGKYFIVHEKDTVWHLSGPHCGDNRLFGDMQVLQEWHKSYLNNPSGKDNPYDRKDSLQKQVVNELHIYTSQVYAVDSARVFIPLDSIAYIEKYQWQNKVIAPVVLGGAGVILFTVLFVAAVNGIARGFGDIFKD